MSFRTVEITNPAELHVQKQQLIIAQEKGTANIPIDDILNIVCTGPNIRISTLAISKLIECGISIITIDEQYNASSITIPIKGNIRQSMVIHKQIELINTFQTQMLWAQIIKKKIENQSKVLTYLELDKENEIYHLAQSVDINNTDEIEALAAKKYFQFLSPGMHRRVESPLNSRLNYGYAVIRNAIIRSLMNKGFQPAIGIHHCNQLNSFNLADDLIEPFRPLVDQIALHIEDESLFLTKEVRTQLAKSIHCYCEMNKKKETVANAIDHMVDSIKEYMFSCQSDQLCDIHLPNILPLEIKDILEE